MNVEEHYVAHHGVMLQLEDEMKAAGWGADALHAAYAIAMGVVRGGLPVETETERKSARMGLAALSKASRDTANKWFARGRQIASDLRRRNRL